MNFNVKEYLKTNGLDINKYIIHYTNWDKMIAYDYLLKDFYILVEDEFINVFNQKISEIKNNNKVYEFVLNDKIKIYLNTYEKFHLGDFNVVEYLNDKNIDINKYKINYIDNNQKIYLYYLLKDFHFNIDIRYEKILNDFIDKYGINNLNGMNFELNSNYWENLIGLRFSEIIQ